MTDCTRCSWSQRNFDACDDVYAHKAVGTYWKCHKMRFAASDCWRSDIEIYTRRALQDRFNLRIDRKLYVRHAFEVEL